MKIKFNIKKILNIKALYSPYLHRNHSFLQKIDVKIFDYLKISSEIYNKLQLEMVDLSYKLGSSNMNSEGKEILKEEIQRLSNQISKLICDVENYKEFDGYINEVHNSEEFIKEANELKEYDLVKTTQVEINKIKENILKLRNNILEGLITKNNIDIIFMEIKSASGGLESALFAEDLAQVYQKVSEDIGFEWKVIEYSQADVGKKALKSAKFQITGDDVFSFFKYESGVHKVQRVPSTDSKGRVHSSTCQVMILTESKDDYEEEDINERELRYEFMRAGGAGGQHVNKTESACRITHIPSGLSVHISESREQHMNKAKAYKLLKMKINQMKKEKFMDNLQETRKSLGGTGALFEKIRTYNYPDSRVTDHRIGVTINGIDKMMNGLMLVDLVNRLKEDERNIKINDIIEKLSNDNNI